MPLLGSTRGCPLTVEVVTARSARPHCPEWWAFPLEQSKCPAPAPSTGQVQQTCVSVCAGRCADRGGCKGREGIPALAAHRASAWSGRKTIGVMRQEGMAEGRGGRKSIPEPQASLLTKWIYCPRAQPPPRAQCCRDSPIACVTHAFETLILLEAVIPLLGLYTEENQNCTGRYRRALLTNEK